MEAIRHGLWGVREKLINRERPSGSENMLKDIEGKLGLAQSELQVPGGILNEEFEKNIQSTLQSFFQGDGRLKEAEIPNAERDLEELSAKVDKKGSLIEPLEVDDEHQQLVKEVIETVLRKEEPEQQVSAIPIIGSRTSTTLAQRVYHDRRVQAEFDIRHWVCMCELDHDHPSKLLDQVFRQQTCDDGILDKFHSIVDGKRYLLILDGTRQANLGEFLSDLLRGVSYGSKVILTASDEATLGNMNPLFKPADAPMKLADQLVLRQDVWDSFEKVAFKDEKKERDNELLIIGKKICIQYSTVPRLLKLIASYLSSKHTVEEWKNLHNELQRTLPVPAETNLSNFNLNSREEFQSNIEQCESYCSLFPKDYEFSKTDLIHLWDSQELLQTPTKRPEELVGEEYFEELCNNMFFFESTKDGGGEVLSYKTQGKVNEFLKGVAKPEFHFVDEATEKYDGMDLDRIRHLSINVDTEWKGAPSWLGNAKTLVSLLFFPKKVSDYAVFPNLKDMLKGLTRLQALDLVAVNCDESILSSLEELKELRYLRLGVSSRRRLPESVTKLENLQTLDLRHSGVIVLPEDIHNLRSLRHLYTGGGLNYMPPTIEKLEYLRTLDVFNVREEEELKRLDGLKDLGGKLTVCFNKNRYDRYTIEGMSNNMNVQNLSGVAEPSLLNLEAVDDRSDSLQPRPGLRSITIFREKKETDPKQLSFRHSVFSSLASIHIEKCAGFQGLLGLSTLPHLRSLELCFLEIAYVEADDDGAEPKPSTSLSKTKHYFPSLEYVMLGNLPSLVAWSSRRNLQQQNPIPSHCLSLCINGCEKMRSMPLMRSLVSLEANKISWTLLKTLLSTTAPTGPSPSATLKKLEIVSIDSEATLSITNLYALKSLEIRRCPKLNKLELKSLKSLHRLKIHECGELVHITCIPGTLSSLESLEIKCCEKLELINKSEARIWKVFNDVTSLKFINIFRLDSLETALSSLEKLEVLSLHSICELRALPERLGNLKKLRKLTLRNCPFLRKLPESLDSHSDLHCDIDGCPKLPQHAPA